MTEGPGEWVDINSSERVNDLMRQNWALLNEVAAILPESKFDADAAEEVNDLLSASCDVDLKLSEAVDAEWRLRNGAVM